MKGEVSEMGNYNYEELIEDWRSTYWIDLDIVEKCIKDGVPVKALHKALLWLIPENFDNFEDDMLELCTLLHKEGISASKIQELLNVVDSSNLISWETTFYKIVARESQEWQKIGIDPAQYIGRYVGYVLDYTDVESEFKDLKGSSPELYALASETLLKKLSMEKIIEQFDDPEYFIDCCVNDTEELGRKFVSEIGYKVGRNLYDWMLAILTGSPEALNVNEVIKNLA